MNNKRLEQSVRKIVEDYREKGYFPSASVRVFTREGTLCSVQTGDCAEDSWFDCASLTKVATATQILFLAEKGKLDLDSPVSGYLAEIGRDSWLAERMNGITPRRLLTHTSSLIDWYPFYSRGGEDFFTALKYALIHTPRTQGVVYSDLNYMLLGKLLERIHGMDLKECLKENLVKRWNLGDMTYCPEPDLPVVPSDYGNAIEMRMCAERGIPFDGFRPLGVPVHHTVNDGNAYYYFHGVAGHAGIFARPEAYERLCRRYMCTDSPLLILAQKTQPDSPGRGLGFQTGEMYPYGCGHTGFTGTGIYFSREKNLGVISFTNRLFYPEGNPNPTGDFRKALHTAVADMLGQEVFE